MSKRLLGVVFTALLALAVFAGPAAAVEEGAPEAHELPSLDEVGTQSEIAQEFFPDAWEAPTVFPWFALPLLIGAGLLALYVLVVYLFFQPRFAEERRAKSKKRR
jgi:hypothetical protein